MSDLTPFGEANIERLDISEVGPFRPDLEGFDFAAYESRQGALDELIREHPNEQITVEQIMSVAKQFPGPDVKLNNIHEVDVFGDFERSSDLSLSVWSGSKFGGSAKYVIARAMVGTEMVIDRDTSIGYGVFKDSVMPRLDLRGVDATGANFEDAILSMLRVDGDTILEGASFRGSYIVGIEGLTEDHVLRADFTGARSVVRDQETSLEGILANGFGTEKRGVSKLAEAIDPVPVSVKDRLQRLIPRMNFRGLVSQGLIAENAAFSGKDFTGSIWQDPVTRLIQLRGAVLSGSILKEGVMDDGDFVSAWMPGAIIEGTSMQRTSWRGANLVGAYFRGVDLTGAFGLGQANTNGAIFEDCTLPDGIYYENRVLVDDNPPRASELGSGISEVH